MASAYSKPSPVGEGGIRAFASMTDEVFAFSLSNLPSGIPCPDTSSTASGPPSPTGEGFLSSTEGGIYSFRCKAHLCFALRALLGFSERTEEQSALAPLCKHRLASFDYHHGSAVYIIHRRWHILLSAQHPRVGCVAPLLGFSERTEEQSALAHLCKHRLASFDYTPFGSTPSCWVRCTLARFL